MNEKSWCFISNKHHPLIFLLWEMTHSDFAHFYCIFLLLCSFLCAVHISRSVGVLSEINNRVAVCLWGCFQCDWLVGCYAVFSSSAHMLIGALFHAVGRLGSEVKLIINVIGCGSFNCVHVYVELHHASVICSISCRSAWPNLIPFIWHNKFRAQIGRTSHQMGMLE